MRQASVPLCAPLRTAGLDPCLRRHAINALMWLNSPSLLRDRRVCLFSAHRSTAPKACHASRSHTTRCFGFGMTAGLQPSRQRDDGWIRHRAGTDRAGMYVTARRTALPILRCVSLDRRTPPIDAAAGSIQHRRPPRLSSAGHPDQAIRPIPRQPKSRAPLMLWQKIAFRAARNHCRSSVQWLCRPLRELAHEV